MSVRPRGATVLVALLLAALAAFAAPALASPVTATIRVQGFTSTVIPTTTLATDARPIVSTCCDDPKATPPVVNVGIAHGFTVPSALTLARRCRGRQRPAARLHLVRDVQGLLRRRVSRRVHATSTTTGVSS